MCAWPPPLQRQVAETPYRRHLIANSRITEMKSGNCGNRVFIIALLFGRRTGDLTRPSLERFSTRQKLLPAETGSICRRNPFIASGSTKSKSPSCGGEPWHVQLCRILRREQSVFALVSLVEHCSTGDTSFLLMVDLVNTTLPTLRLTQQYQTTTTSPLSRVVRLSLCRNQVSNCLVCLCLVCFGDDSHQRDARRSHPCGDRRNAETAH